MRGRIHWALAFLVLSALVLVLQPGCGVGFPGSGDFTWPTEPIIFPCQTGNYFNLIFENQSEDATYKVFFDGERIMQLKPGERQGPRQFEPGRHTVYFTDKATGTTICEWRDRLFEVCGSHLAACPN